MIQQLLMGSGIGASILAPPASADIITTSVPSSSFTLKANGDYDYVGVGSDPWVNAPSEAPAFQAYATDMNSSIAQPPGGWSGEPLNTWVDLGAVDRVWTFTAPLGGIAALGLEIREKDTGIVRYSALSIAKIRITLNA